MTDNCLKQGTILRGKHFQYRIVRVIGNGTFGITYLAEMFDRDGNNTGMLSAVKEFYMRNINSREGCDVVVDRDAAVFRQYFDSFEREAKTMAQVRRDNVVSIIEYFGANCTGYYSMTYIKGGSLDDKIKESGLLSEKESLSIALSIAEAMQTLHRDRIIHLDIKPSNIMMLNGVTPMLIDFGLSKVFSGSLGNDDFAALGPGTPGYAPIEQGTLKSNMRIPFTIDIYSLGATLFKMLAGQCPPNASTLLGSGIPDDELEDKNVTAATIRIVHKAMEPIAGDRYQSMRELSDDIRHVLNCIEKGEPTIYLPSEVSNDFTKTESINVWNDFENPNEGFVTVDGVRRTPSGSYMVDSDNPQIGRCYQGRNPMYDKAVETPKVSSTKNIVVGISSFLVVGGICGFFAYHGLFNTGRSAALSDIDDETNSEIELVESTDNTVVSKSEATTASTSKSVDWGKQKKRVVHDTVVRSKSIIKQQQAVDSTLMWSRKVKQLK